MGKIILPNTRYVLQKDERIVFLAGPIQGAPKWQDEAIKILFSQKSDLVIASPGRNLDNGLNPYVVEGDKDYFDRQRKWEKHYLSIGSKIGAIMFWLPGKIEDSSVESYGAMTRKELGDWTTEKKFIPNVRLTIGTDGYFSSIRTLKYDISQDLPDMIIQGTLEETCAEALRLTNG